MATAFESKQLFKFLGANVKTYIFAAMDRLENRAVIEFCRDPWETPTKACKMITVARSKTSVSHTLVFKWYKRFQQCGDLIQKRSVRGRKSIVTENTLTSICVALNGERRLTVRALSERFDMSIGAVYKVLTKQLNMTKVHNGDYFEKK